MANHDEYSFERFQELALSNQGTVYDRIGFPGNYREGHEDSVIEDIILKLSNLSVAKCNFLEIGPGISTLPTRLSEVVSRLNGKTTWVDGDAVLKTLPNSPNTTKLVGRFPDVPLPSEEFDAILAYSVVHYVHGHSSLDEFLDGALRLLKPGGQLLLGDLPNVSKRKRYFSSKTGMDFHKNFMQTEEDPKINTFETPDGKFDDSNVLQILLRCRLLGFESYVMPQNSNLAFSNRREDILVIRN